MYPFKTDVKFLHCPNCQQAGFGHKVNLVCLYPLNLRKAVISETNLKIVVFTGKDNRNIDCFDRYIFS